MSPEITFGRSAEHYILEAFGWDVRREDGGIVDEETGELIEGWGGHTMRVDEFGGGVEDKENGEPIPIRNNFCDVFDWMEWSQDTEKEIKYSVVDL